MGVQLQVVTEFPPCSQLEPLLQIGLAQQSWIDGKFESFKVTPEKLESEVQKIAKRHRKLNMSTSSLVACTNISTHGE